MDLGQMRDCVVTPALQRIGAYSVAAMRLVIGTGLVESGYVALRQTGGGPALGFWQMEVATEQDIWATYLPSQPGFDAQLRQLVTPYCPRTDQLVWNLQYAAAMCRIKYYRSPQRLPDASDLEGMAAMWKSVYNAGGKGDAHVFMERATAAGVMNL